MNWADRSTGTHITGSIFVHSYALTTTTSTVLVSRYSPPPPTTTTTTTTTTTYNNNHVPFLHVSHKLFMNLEGNDDTTTTTTTTTTPITNTQKDIAIRDNNVAGIDIDIDSNNQITTNKDIYQNGVAKFLSNFMSKPSSSSSSSSSSKDDKTNDPQNNEMSNTSANEMSSTSTSASASSNNDTDDDHDDDEIAFLRRRNQIMNEVIQLQRTEEYWDQPKISKLPLHILVQVLDYEIYYKEWFVTGYINPIYFSSTNFTFQDPDVKINTIQSYARGVQQIFDYSNTARAELISTKVVTSRLDNDHDDNHSNIITCTWRLSGKVNIGPNGLMIKPYIVYTDYTICPETGLIIYQRDRFDIPSWDILLSALFPFLIGFVTSPPAPKPIRRTPMMPDLSQYM